MKYAGQLTISRPRGDGYEAVRIAVRDETSFIEFIEIEIGLKEFAESLFTACQDCTFELRSVEKVGWKHEHKDEVVFVPEGPYKQQKEIAAQALKPFEVEGWRGSVSDATNHHRWVRKDPPKGKKGGWYNVTFRRHVPPKSPFPPKEPA